MVKDILAQSEMVFIKSNKDSLTESSQNVRHIVSK